MTNKTSMPEPVAWYRPSEDGFDSSFRDHSTILSCPSNPWEDFIPLITTTQAEAYANARVRGALEEAAMILKANAEACHSDTRIMLRANAEAILSLIKRIA